MSKGQSENPTGEWLQDDPAKGQKERKLIETFRDLRINRFKVLPWGEYSRILRSSFNVDWRTKKSREEKTLHMTAEEYLEEIWLAFHLGQRLGRREGGIPDHLDVKGAKK